MSAGTGLPPEHSGLRDLPGDLAENLHAPKGLRKWWQRLYLVPFCILLVAVVVATVVGAITRDRLAQAQFEPPVNGMTTGEGLPGTCAAPQAPLPDQQPWLAQARSTSEQTFQVNLDDAAATVEGEDGYVFWGDVQASNFSQAIGRRVLTQAEMDGWYAAMDSLRDRLGEQGIDLVIQIVPAKWSVTPEHLPAWTHNIVGSTTFDYLRYAHPDLPVMDMRGPLQDAQAERPVYTPLNSHWNTYGGSVGWQQLAECLTAVDGERYAGLAPLEIASYETEPAGNEFEPFGYADAGVNEVPVWAQEPAAMTLTTNDGSEQQVATDRPVDMLELPATTVTESAQSEASALILRDSQGNSISPGWQAGFAETWQYPHNLDKPDQPVDMLQLAQQHGPDVVVLELTERHLNFVPPVTY